MGSCMRQMVMCVTLVLVCGASASAETVAKQGTFNGVAVHYKVVVPNGYDASRAYPTILTFPPGNQDMPLVDNRLEANWREEAERRGYVVVSPAAPDGRLFFDDGRRVFPAFIERIFVDYQVKGGKLILAGASNGGLSAFYVASHYPQYFTTLIGYPGLLREVTPAAVAALRGLCIYMHVGELDAGWRPAMAAEADELRRAGLNVTFSVEPGQHHVIATLDGSGARRLYDEIEACR